MASMTGALAEAFYGEVPQDLEAKSMKYLDETLRAVVNAFDAKYL